MLFRRFAIVTTSIALMGILVSNLMEATDNRSESFSIQNRVQEWKRHDAQRACERAKKLCMVKGMANTFA